MLKEHLLLGMSTMADRSLFGVLGGEDAEGHPIEAGHFFPEEALEQTSETLSCCFRGAGQSNNLLQPQPAGGCNRNVGQNNFP